MSVERLSLSIGEEEVNHNNNKAPRLPRWTRQELLVLIQGKRFAESRVRRGRSAVLAEVEPKWSSVSSYCKSHGVNRGPVQCRKRWSNLAGDFKKIKEWESQINKEEADSFWVMRNDLRRERKLPGFFDREVYDILDAGGGDGPSSASLALSLAPEVVFDSGRTTDAALFSDKPLISDTENEDQGVPPPSPSPPPAPVPAAETSTGAEPRETDRKRKRDDDAAEEEEGEEETSLQKQLIEAMERNGRLLSSQLEIQNVNSQLDREQRKDEANTLFSVLNKLADAMSLYFARGVQQYKCPHD
ncbi:hypothetical protein M8C21_029436, partial [Ambrosia artemisiifolia]